MAQIKNKALLFFALIALIAMSGCSQKYIKNGVDLQTITLSEYKTFTKAKQLELTEEYIQVYRQEGWFIESFNRNLEDDRYRGDMVRILHSIIGADDPDYSRRRTWDEVEQIVTHFLRWTKKH